ncbi:DUF2306 domain-containing protein [Promicromonospora sp. NPDC060271]|uniref:DUF2306 domain-containing protein n=1 Tax=Promicromonospora sp. NPDC060271 TaxID=3347089 RepID=UPI003663708F
MATDTTTAPAPAGAPRKIRWWRRPWIAPLAIITAVFLATALPRYVGLDPAQSLVPTDRGPAFYSALVTHIFAGSIMLSAGVLQLWPWLRAHHPHVHRWSGRVYVASAIPTAVAALVVAQFPSAGVAQQVANTVMGTLLLTFTLLGYRAVRQRRFADHREWMVRSTALAFSIVANRFWSTFLIAVYVPGALTDPNIGFGSPEIEGAAIASAWMSFVANLLFAEWWLHRKPKKRGRAQKAG